MTTAALPTPMAPKNRQARGTVTILNLARWVGVAFFALSAVGGIITLLIGMVNGDSATALAGFAGSGFSVVVGALFYAIIGWYVDTLDLLHKIARRIAA